LQGTVILAFMRGRVNVQGASPNNQQSDKSQYARMTSH